MLTLWDSMVRAFAGPDPERAVFYPRDDRFPVEREETATHFEVLAAEGVDQLAPRPARRTTSRHQRPNSRGSSMN